jgi:hypothetical protein
LKSNRLQKVVEIENNRWQKIQENLHGETKWQATNMDGFVARWAKAAAALR